MGASDVRYVRIATRLWTDEKFRRLSEDGRMLYLYILTSPHSNMAGHYVLPKPYVCYDLGWSEKRLGKPFGELLRNGLVKYCETTDVILVLNYLKYNTIQNGNQAKGANRRVRELPHNSLTDDFLTAVERFAEPFRELLANGLPEGFGKSDTETETETDTEKEDHRCNSQTSYPVSVHKEAQEQTDSRQTEFADDSIPYQLAVYLQQKILEQDKNTRSANKADLQKWAIEADRMLRLDHRDAREAAQLMTWAQQDQFWRSNILSMKKFREKYDTLKRQAGRMDTQKGSSAVDRALRERGVM